MIKTVYSIGLGPGDYELITAKAKRVLEESDIVVVPQSDEPGRSVARDIILHYIDQSKILMYYFPMNNDRKELKRRYNELAEKIMMLAKEGKCVSYVTMGDPTIFSTSNYITERLRVMGIEVRLIPGISSINAASTMLGLPLCLKGEHFGVYEMPGNVEKTVELIQRHPTTVFMKVNKKLPVLIEAVRITSPDKASLSLRMGLSGEMHYDMLNCSPPPEDVYLSYLSVAVIRRKMR